MSVTQGQMICVQATRWPTARPPKSFFPLDGTFVGTEKVAPYCLGGDTNGVANGYGAGLAGGKHTVEARATVGGTAYASSIQSFTIVLPNQAPTVSLAIPPATGATFLAPASITLSATATDSDGTISKVEFYAGSTLIGSDPSTPYSLTWAHVATGSYSLTVKAIDNAGAIATSADGSITVQATGVVSFTLFNADTDLPIPGYDPIPANAVIDPAALGTKNLNIRANTNPATVGSVAVAAWMPTPPITSKAGRPTSGSNAGSSINRMTFTAGAHQLTATAYSAASATGPY